MRLIDADRLLKKNRRMYAPDEIDSIAPIATACVMVDDVHRAPTIDAVQVVRCRECKHRGNERECPMCEMVSTWDEDDGSEYYLADRTEDNGFCHNGAKMDSN